MDVWELDLDAEDLAQIDQICANAGAAKSENIEVRVSSFLSYHNI